MSAPVLQCQVPGCGLSPTDPVHDRDEESYDHDFQRIVYRPSPTRPSVWINRGWWTFLAIAAALVGAALLLRAVL